MSEFVTSDELQATLNSRLKSLRHEADDHLDRALVAKKIKPSESAGDLLGSDGTDTRFRSPGVLGVDAGRDWVVNEIEDAVSDVEASVQALTDRPIGYSREETDARILSSFEEAAADDHNHDGAYLRIEDHANKDWTTNEIEVAVEDHATNLFTNRYSSTSDLPLARMLGSSCKGMSCPPWVVTTSATPVDGRLYFVPVFIPFDCTITGALYASVTTGVFTANNDNKLALFKTDGTTLTQLATTANNGASGSLWKRTANDIVSESFSTSIDVPSGVYYVAMLRNESANSTPPTVGITATYLTAFQPATALAMSGSNFISVGYVASATMPTTQAISGLTKFNQTWWVGVY